MNVGKGKRLEPFVMTTALRDIKGSASTAIKPVLQAGPITASSVGFQNMDEEEAIPGNSGTVLMIKGCSEGVNKLTEKATVKRTELLFTLDARAVIATLDVASAVRRPLIVRNRA